MPLGGVRQSGVPGGVPGGILGGVSGGLQKAVVRGPESVGRLAVQSLCSPGWLVFDGDAERRELLRSVYRIRAAVRESRCAAIVTAPAGGPKSGGAWILLGIEPVTNVGLLAVSAVC